MNEFEEMSATPEMEDKFGSIISADTKSGPICCKRCGWGIASDGSCVNINCDNLGKIIYQNKR